MFAAEIVMKSKDNRRSVRSVVDMPTRIAGDNDWRAITRVLDISRHGARLQCNTPLPKGLIVWLTIDDSKPRRGEVVWTNNGDAAIKFDQPLAAAATMAIVEKYGNRVKPDTLLDEMIIFR